TTWVLARYLANIQLLTVVLAVRVEARYTCLIASLPAEHFRELLPSEPGVAQALLPRLVRTLRALTTRVYEFSTLAVKNRIHAEHLRLATLAPRDGKRARRRTGCREHVKEYEMDDQAFDELKMRMTIVRQQARWPAGADRATISHFAWYKISV